MQVLLVCCLLVELQCPEPVAPANGSRTYHYLSVGSLVQYHCQSGHRLVGESVRTCVKRQEKAEWSGPPPVCEGEIEQHRLVRRRKEAV